MIFPRRQFLHLAAGAAALPAISQIARAQAAYPTRPVHIIVGYAAGGVTDIIARLTGQWLSSRLGRPFIIDNRPGAGSNLATETVVRASPDGYTLLQASGSNSYNEALYDNLNFNFVRDIAPVASVIRTVGVMEVNPSFPARNLPEFIAYAKANPGKINMATAGIGSGPHLAGELFKKMAGVDLVTVHYRGSGPALPDLLGGQIQVMFDLIVSSIEHIRAGKLRALGVTTATRISALPDVPPIGDFVPGYEAIGWQGIGAPKNTPVEIIDKLNGEINAALADDGFKARLSDLGGLPFAVTPKELGQFIAEFTDKWGKLIRTANIKGE